MVIPYKAVTPRIRLLALDIDGTLLSPTFEVSQRDLSALLIARDMGVEIILVTGRRHTFAMEIAASLGFDLWMITSNGAVTKSSSGELFHRELLPRTHARRLIAHMNDYRRQAVLTFDPRLAVDQPPGRPDHQRHDHQHRGVSG